MKQQPFAPPSKLPKESQVRCCTWRQSAGSERARPKPWRRRAAETPLLRMSLSRFRSIFVVQRWGWIVGMVCESALLHPAVVNSLGPWVLDRSMTNDYLFFLRILAIVWLHVFYKNDLANKQLIRTWPQQRLPIATITSNPICLDLGCTHFNKTPQRDRIHLPNMSHSLLHAPGGSCFFFRTCSIAGHAAWVAMVIGKFRRESHGAKGPGCIWSLGSQFDGLNLECENKNQHLLDFVIGKHTLNLTYLSYIYM